MSTSPNELPTPTSPLEGDPESSSSSSASSSSSNPVASAGELSGSVGASSGSSSSASSSSSSSSTSDSKRVVPKWLGKKIGRFRLQGLLGQGAVGRVFRAEDSILHRRVALKVITLHTDDGQINRNADQFLTEARAAAALEHPHVVQIYEAGESGNLCYIAMELLDGGSLKDLVGASGPMDPGRAALLAADAAEALAAAHEAGITHRDIKPANLMLTRQGRCKVTDFGLATFGDAESVSTARAAGTPLFAAPEVIRGTAADERSDVYSLGATLYYLLTGRPPYTAGTRGEVLRKHVNEPIPDLRGVRPGLPEPLVAAVEKALDKDPGQRFTSAQQFARVLRVQTIPVAPPPPAWQPTAEAIGAASVANLSGLTAVSGSGRLRGGPAAGEMSSGDLAPTDPGQGHPNVPGDDGGGATIDYAAPPPPTATDGRRPWWATPAGLSALVAAAASLVFVVAAAVLRVERQHPVAVAPVPILPAPATPPAPPVPTPSAPAPAALASTALAPAASESPTPAAATADAAPIRVTDVARLTRIASGKDPAHPDRRATVTGTVTTAAVSATGKVFRVTFAGTPFAVAYFDNDGLYDRMANAFGGQAGEGLLGRSVRVTGQVRLFHGDPEIVVQSPWQVTVLNPR